VNPNVAAGTPISYSFPVKMFNYTSTFAIPDGNTVYMTRSSSQNVYFTDSPSVSLTFTSTQSGAPQLAQFTIPYERYTNEFPITNAGLTATNDRAAIQFDLQVPAALPDIRSSPPTSRHTYDVNLPVGISLPSQTYTGDVLTPQYQC
jgi:hypothetical protein